MNIAHPIGALVCILAFAGAVCFLIAIWPARKSGGVPLSPETEDDVSPSSTDGGGSTGSPAGADCPVPPTEFAPDLDLIADVGPPPVVRGRRLL